MNQSERIIREVERRPALWDPKNPDYHNRQMLDELWNSVALAVKMTKTNVKSKWRNLRDSFHKEVKKVAASCPSAEDGEAYNGTWIHYNSLLFLKGKTKPRKPELKYKTEQFDSADELPLITQLEEGQRYPKRHSDAYDIIDTSRPAKQQKINEEPLSEYEKEALRIKREKIQLLRANDDDMHFFQSMVPFFKEMNSIQKLRVRSKIQQIVIDELTSASNLHIVQCFTSSADENPLVNPHTVAQSSC